MNTEQVTKIKEERANGVSAPTLAKKFNVSTATIYNVTKKTLRKARAKTRRVNTSDVIATDRTVARQVIRLLETVPYGSATRALKIANELFA